MRLEICFLLFFITIQSWAQVSSNAAAPLKPPLELTSDFAEYRKNHFHSGVDFRVNNKTDLSVFSVWDGYVARIRFNSASYGRAVYVAHPNGYTSVYGHLDSFAPFIDSLVKKHQYTNRVFETDISFPENLIPVRKGQVLGIAGNSGFSFGAHLHFEIRDTKTEEPLNPLKFIPVEDNMDPVFYQLAVYRLQTGGFLPASPQYYKAIKKGTYYTTANEITVPDTFFLGFDVQDYQNLTYMRLLPQKIEVRINDSLVWKIEFDRFSFDQTASCRGVFDHAAGLKNTKQIVTTYTGNHQRQGFFKVYSNDGLFVLPDTGKYLLTVKATDTEFNQAEFRTTLRKTKLSTTTTTSSNLIPAKMVNVFKTPFLSVKCDTGTFYSNLALDRPLVREYGSGDGLYWEIGYPEIPLVKPLQLSFSEDLNINEKTLLVQMENYRVQKCWKPAENPAGIKTVLLDRPGIFRLMQDTTPPLIGKTNLPYNNKITWQNEITFVVTDNSSSVSSYNAYINGEWTLMTYDLKYNLFSVPLNQNQKSLIKTLRVEFFDPAGNKAEKEFSVSH